MKAVVVGTNGPQVTDVPEPETASNQIKIRVHACGLNRADSQVAMGRIHGRTGGPGTVIGIEFAGEVVAVGDDVAREGGSHKVGDRVMCSGSGGWAEYAVTDWGRAMPLPDESVSWIRAATLPIGLSTMHNAIVTAGALKSGESILIQGASSGVGLIGMQIARLMGASLVIGSSTHPDRRARLREFGADLAIDSRSPDWVDEVLEATDGKGVDLIVDQVSGYTVNDNLAATRILGRIVNVGRLGGTTTSFNCDLHALRRIQYIGVTFRTRTVAEVRDIMKAMKEDLWEAVQDGYFHLPVDREFPLDEAPAAVSHMRDNRHFGKIVLNLDS